jgi:RNA polymerase sigma-70 factor (ECF subfamily)
MRKPPEKELMERLQRGDERAFADLADAYSSRIFQLAYRYLRNRQDAEEVVQDVLYKVHRKIAEFRGDAALSSWIFRITFNTTISRLRATRDHHQQAEPARFEQPDGGRRALLRSEPADWSQMGDERVFRSQLRRRVFRAIQALPAIYRAPVVLRDIHGMSTEEASEMLQVKDQTLKSRLHRGRLILRKQLSDFAGGLSLHRPIYGT